MKRKTNKKNGITHTQRGARWFRINPQTKGFLIGLSYLVVFALGVYWMAK
jgi:hypothetical protein